MDFTRLSQGEKVAGVSGILLILFMFVFKWFGLKFTGGVGTFGVSVEGSRNAWGSYGFIDIVLFVTALAAIGLALLAASEGEIGLPVAASAIVAGLGILSVVLIVISIISPPDFGVDAGSGLDHTRKIGVWLGLIAAAGVGVGGYMAMQEEGTSFSGETGRFGGGGDAGTGAPPPPPPPASGGPPPSSPPPSGP
jgi:hypothetical protein